MHQLFLLSAKLIELSPRLHPASARDRVRVVVGCTLGFGVTIAVVDVLFGHSLAVLLAGPVAASTVLLFAVSSGALSQPWPLVGGYLLAALIAVGLGTHVGHSLVTACWAMALVLLGMFLLRCVHPPAAALALVLVLHDASSDASLITVLAAMVGASALLLSAMLYNNLTGRPYPDRGVPANRHHTADISTDRRVGVTQADLRQALKEFGQFVDITPGDLERLVRSTERAVLRRQMGSVRAGQVMSKDVRYVAPDTSVLTALQILRHHHIKTLPVLDRHGELVGIVSLTDLMGQIDKPDGKLFAARMKAWRDQPIRKWMTSPVISVASNVHVADLIPLMSSHGLHSVPVLEEGQLVGLVTQTDLIGALHRDLLAHL